jgi:hypothetical protein
MGCIARCLKRAFAGGVYRVFSRRPYQSVERESLPVILVWMTSVGCRLRSLTSRASKSCGTVTAGNSSEEQRPVGSVQSAVERRHRYSWCQGAVHGWDLVVAGTQPRSHMYTPEQAAARSRAKGTPRSHMYTPEQAAARSRAKGTPRSHMYTPEQAAARSRAKGTPRSHMYTPEQAAARSRAKGTPYRAPRRAGWCCAAEGPSSSRNRPNSLSSARSCSAATARAPASPVRRSPTPRASRSSSPRSGSPGRAGNGRRPCQNDDNLSQNDDNLSQNDDNLSRNDDN